MKKINILVVPSDNRGGVGFYRSSQPHKHLMKMYPDEFAVTFNMKPDWEDREYFMPFDLIHVHKGVFPNMEAFKDTLKHLRSIGKATVYDIDDSWDVSPTHPLYYTQKFYHIDDIMRNNLSEFDTVTTTTPIFAKEIEPYNKNVVVLANAIDPNDDRFIIDRKPSAKVRVGFVMGSAHEADLKQMGNFISLLQPETLDKIQINLCGFDIRGSVRVVDEKNNKTSDRPIQPMETTWFRYENMVTNNRKLLSQRYDRFLHMFVPDLEYPDVENEKYRRNWTKDIDHYYKHYENIDILYAPLEIKHFNLVKSQLKAIECCFSKTAIIAQNYGPYTIDLKHALDENDNYNGGNALLVDGADNPKAWAHYTDMLVQNRELLTKLQNAIHDSLKDKYNLDEITKKRAELYRSLVNN